VSDDLDTGNDVLAGPENSGPASRGTKVLDLTRTPITKLEQPETVDLEQGRDKVRAVLAVGLLLLLAGVVMLGFILVFTAPTELTQGTNGAPVRVDGHGLLEARSMFVQSVLAVVAGLFGAATGFYFGSSHPQR
jgi:hypothetical protein